MFHGHSRMRAVLAATALACIPCSSNAAEVTFDVGVGHIIGIENTQSYGFRGSIGIDLGILEPALVAHWSPGPSPGDPAHSGQRGGQLLHGVAGMLRVHTPPPHQLGLGVGFGSGRMQAAQRAGADDVGYRGTAGPYTILEAAHRYNVGPVTSIGLAFTTHFFTHVETIGDLGFSCCGPFPYGLMPFFSFMADVGLHVPIF